MAKRIYFDAGHGGSDPGAVEYVKEKDVNIKVVKAAVSYLKANYNCEVYQDITDDSTHTISARANKWGADLFVSVHFNAGGGNGYEALVYSSANKSLGQCFEKYVKAVGQNSRGVKYRPELNVLRLTNMKAILNEIAFVDNKKDIQDWNEDHELKKMGEALAKAAADWLNLTKKAEEAKPSKKSVETIAKEVIAGKWGNGDARRTALKKAGYNADEVQKKVNELLEKPVATSIKVGSKVKVKSGAKDLNTGKLYSSFVYKTTYTVISISGNRVVFGLNGKITGATNKANLKLV